MFCINCGIEIVLPEQNFCYNCGNEVLFKDTLRSSKITTKKPNDSGLFPVKKRSSRDGPGPFSKKCLGFGITSNGIAAFGFFGGFFIFIFNLISSRYSYGSIFSSMIIPGIIITLITHLIGIIFGSVSRTNRIRAERFESDNTVEKIGKYLGIIGTILNIFGFIAFLIGGVIMISSNYGILI